MTLHRREFLKRAGQGIAGLVAIAACDKLPKKRKNPDPPKKLEFVPHGDKVAVKSRQRGLTSLQMHLSEEGKLIQRKILAAERTMKEVVSESLYRVGTE